MEDLLWRPNKNSPPREGKNKYTNKSSTYFADGKNHSQKKTREREREREREECACSYLSMKEGSLFVLFCQKR